MAAGQAGDFDAVGYGVGVGGDGGDGCGVSAHADLVEGEDAGFFDFEELGYEGGIGRVKDC